MTLGERNNNPLNIRRVAGTHWKGQCDEQTDNAFVQFRTIEFGIRAAFVLLHTYSTKYHANCIRDIISRWAPPTENDTERYIRNVCFWSGLGGLQLLTEQDWPRLVRAMALIESRMHLDELPEEFTREDLKKVLAEKRMAVQPYGTYIKRMEDRDLIMPVENGYRKIFNN